MAKQKYWTTTEVRIGKRAYRTGGAKAVQALLPHRSIGSIQARATFEKWEFWTSIRPGSIAETAFAHAKVAPITARDLAYITGMKVANLSAILGTMCRRGVLVRDKMRFTTTKGLQVIYAYSPNPEYLEAIADETEMPQPTAVR